MRPCVFVIGTRAQLVKVAPVLRKATAAGFPHTVWLSGQHSESMDDLITDFGVTSTIHRASRGHERATITGLLTWLPKASVECFKYVRQISVSAGESALVVVHGDTLSTLMSAYAGKCAGGEIVHLESGLTSNSLLDPFPEELLRRLTFRVTDYALCPSHIASCRMRRYGCKEILNTGENTLLDSVRYALHSEEGSRYGGMPPYMVASIHRVKNIYRAAVLSQIVRELEAVSKLCPVRFVLHPATRKRLIKTGLWNALASSPSIKLEKRMPYSRFLSLLSGARCVFTDGGSNQEELSYLGVPTVLFRERSERSEGLGRNVVLRHDIDDLGEYVRSGQVDRLRVECRIDQSTQPSLTAIKALHSWAGIR